MALAVQAAVTEGAAAPCPEHPDVLLDMKLGYDTLADRQLRAWRTFEASAKAEGFDGNSDMELQPLFMYILQTVDEVCPTCGAELPEPESPEHHQ